jgi:hypothetical protein
MRVAALVATLLQQLRTTAPLAGGGGSSCGSFYAPCVCPTATYAVEQPPPPGFEHLAALSKTYNCHACPAWSDTRGKTGRFNASACICQDATYNAAQHGSIECRSDGVVLASARESLGAAQQVQSQPVPLSTTPPPPPPRNTGPAV